MNGAEVSRRQFAAVKPMKRKRLKINIKATKIQNRLPGVSTAGAQALASAAVKSNAWNRRRRSGKTTF